MSTPQTTVYEFDRVAVNHGPILIDGFAEGDSISIDRDAVSFTYQVGNDGKVTRSKVLNRCTKITLRLMQRSDANTKLSALHEADRIGINGVGIVPTMVADLSGVAVYAAAQSWIEAPPQVTFGQDSGTREWVIVCPTVARLDG